MVLLPTERSSTYSRSDSEARSSHSAFFGMNLSPLGDRHDVPRSTSFSASPSSARDASGHPANPSVDSSSVRLPGIHTLFGIKRNDPLDSLGTLAHVAPFGASPPPTAGPSTPSVKSFGTYSSTRSSSSAPSDPSAFALNSSLSSFGRSPTLGHASDSSRSAPDTLASRRSRRTHSSNPPSAPPRSSSLRTAEPSSSSTRPPSMRRRDREPSHEDVPANSSAAVWDTSSDGGGETPTAATGPSPLRPYLPSTGVRPGSATYGSMAPPPPYPSSDYVPASYAHQPPYAPSYGEVPYSRAQFQDIPPSPDSWSAKQSWSPRSSMTSTSSFDTWSLKNPPSVSEDASKPSSPPSPSTPTTASGSTNVHLGRYACSTCPKRFSRPSSLRIHQLSHTGERPHNCSICGRCFSVQSNLRRHLKLHEKAALMAEAAEDVDIEDEGELDEEDY